MIEEHLCKKYGNFTAVDNISFTVHDGEIVGFYDIMNIKKETSILFRPEGILSKKPISYLTC